MATCTEVGSCKKGRACRCKSAFSFSSAAFSVPSRSAAFCNLLAMYSCAALAGLSVHLLGVNRGIEAKFL